MTCFKIFSSFKETEENLLIHPFWYILQTPKVKNTLYLRCEVFLVFILKEAYLNQLLVWFDQSWSQTRGLKVLKI